MAKEKLTNADFCRAAKRLKCEVAAIKAVAQVESAGSGFYSDGFPVILFERHLFRGFTQGRYSAQYPELSGKAGNYGAGGANQRRKFNLAFALNPDAAMKACSWGKFQILGSNHKVCGYATVGDFVDAMKESEGKQLDAFVSFVIGNRLDGHLRNLNWAAFASGYNGKGYRKNAYDTKMANAYARFKRENIDCSATVIVDPAPPASDDVSAPIDPQPPSDTSLPNDTGVIELSAPAKDGATAASTKMTIGGIVVPGFVVSGIAMVKQWVSDGYVSAQDVGSTVLNFIRDNQKYVFLLIALIIVLLIVKKLIKQVTFWIEMITHAMPGLNTIKVIPVEPIVTKAWWRIW